MFCSKKIAIIASVFTLTVWGFISQPIFALRSQYYDFGPYYNQHQVLGLSNLENLPVPSIPDNLMPPPAQGVLPGNLFYGLERAWENTQVAFTFDPVAKDQLRLEIAQERLSEAKSLMDQGKIQAASQTLGDYGQTIQDIASSLSTIAQTNTPQAQDLLNKIEQTVATQTVVATALSLSTPPAQAESWTDAGNTARDALDKVSEIQGEPAIPENLSNGLQQLKEQGLLSEEESNKIYGLKNRSEVREELIKLSSSGGLPPSEIAKLDEGVSKYYPEVQDQQIANWQVVELRSYQAQTQPGQEQIEELKKWQDNPSVPPSNNIKPYLWYNRAQDLAKEVDLSNFSEEQQAQLVKLYPSPVVDNPTYSPPLSPSPSPSSSPREASSAGEAGAADQTSTTTSGGATPTGDATQTATPTADVASPSSSAVSSPTPPQSDPYLQGSDGVLPGQTTYILKQLGENLQFTFTFDPAQKARFRMQQSERRLAEATALSADPKQASLYEAALKDYQQAVNDASTRLKNLQDSKDAKDVAEELEAQISRHEVVFEKGFLTPPTKNPQLIIDAIHATEDAMDRSADKLDRPALPPVLTLRLGDLKAQGLILAEEAEDLVNSDSREEVRVKIRKLLELKTFPLADAKKLDEAQSFTSSSDYNQLVEVRKVEELQNLRSTQADLAQTQTLRASLTSLSQQEAVLNASIDPSVIKREDLEGRDDLIKTYEKLSSTPRPINGGQFGLEATPGAQIALTTPPGRADAVLTACPESAVFKQDVGCVWADTGKNINDYEQYKCDGSRQYYSFAVKKCVAYDETKGFNKDDAQPICPVGYTWSWQTQSCQASTGGILPFPSPSPEPEPIDDQEREERSKKCPEGSSYKAPNGCVWDDSGKSVYDPNQYRCGRGKYYSFEEQKCVNSPKEGEPYPKDSTPACKETLLPDGSKGEGAFWSWADGKCIQAVFPLNQPQTSTINFDPKVSFVAPDSPFYFLKQTTERVQLTLSFTPQAREQVSLEQSQQRLAEAVYALKKNDEAGAKKALAAYTTTMQNLVGDLSKAAISEMAKNEISKRLTEEATEQNLLLQKISALAPATQDTAISAAVSATILGVDKAADIAGEPPIPVEVKTKIESLPKEMISEEDKKKLLEAESRVEARLGLGGLVTNGALTQTDTAFLNEDFDNADPATKIKTDELKKLEQMAKATETKDKTLEKIETNEKIVQNLQEFEKTFEPGKEIPADVRPYVRLTRINEIAQTIRPDIVKLDDFQNRKDVILAVATLQEEFRPTKEAVKQVEDFRRKNPNVPLPLELARIEALSYSLGVRGQAGPCFLPTPPFPANTPCPAPGAAIPIASFVGPTPVDEEGYRPGYPGTGWNRLIVDPVGFNGGSEDNRLVYGQGPKPEKAGICPAGYHWMYDSGGWCMSDSGSYNSSYNYTPTGTGPGYTPYSPYYNAPGAPPSTYGYPTGGGYPSSPYSYGAPYYYGSATTTYTTYPPSGTVPGSGPKPTAPGQCPDGFHWMSDSGGWCMANGNTYVPPGTPDFPAGTVTTETGSYNCGSQPYDPVTKKCRDGACPGGFYWNGSQCVAGNYLPGLPGTPAGSNPGTPWCWSAYLSPEATTCSSGSFWDSSSCTCKSSGSSSGGSPTCPSGQYYNTAARTCVYSATNSANCPSGYTWNGYSCQPSSGTGASCTYPSGGCLGVGAWYDYSSCSCRTSTSYSSPSSYQYGCTPGYYWNGSRCVAGSNEGSGWSDGAARSGSWCQPPSSGCGTSSYWDYGSCYCRPSSTYYGGSGPSSSNSCQGITCGTGTYLDYASCSCKTSSWSNCSPPAGGCGSGWWDTGSCSCRQSSSQGCYNVSASSCGAGWYFDSAACTCRQSTSSGTSGGSTTTSSGSCPSGSHWMSENGGYCMSDSTNNTSSGGSTTTSSGSCPSGYHWMTDNGGWCMSDAARDSGSSGGSTTTTSSPSTSSEPTPAPSASTTTESAPSSSEPSPAPSTSTTTESSPPPSSTESTPPPSP